MAEQLEPDTLLSEPAAVDNNKKPPNEGKTSTEVSEVKTTTGSENATDLLEAGGNAEVAQTEEAKASPLLSSPEEGACSSSSSSSSSSSDHESVALAAACSQLGERLSLADSALQDEVSRLKTAWSADGAGLDALRAALQATGQLCRQAGRPLGGVTGSLAAVRHTLEAVSASLSERLAADRLISWMDEAALAQLGNTYARTHARMHAHTYARMHAQWIAKMW